jgi:hypothetical protein
MYKRGATTTDRRLTFHYLIDARYQLQSPAPLPLLAALLFAALFGQSRLLVVAFLTRRLMAVAAVLG